MNKLIIDEFYKLEKQIKTLINYSKNKKEEIENSYRLKSIQTVIKILENFPDTITSSNQLNNIKSIGKGTIDRINEIINTGKLSELKNEFIDDSYLNYLNELDEIYGIGQKTAFDLFKKYNIKSVEQLKKLYKDKKINLSPNIIKGLKYYGKIKENIPRIEIDNINNYLLSVLSQINNELFLIICGSYRRLKLTSNDIDVILIHPSIKTKKDLINNTFLKLFIQKLIKNNFIIDSFTDVNVSTKYMGLCKYNDNPIRRIDIRFIPYESYYYAILYFTGSKDFNKKMRTIALNMNMTLNEYGLYDKNNNLFIVKSEKEIFNLLNMEYVEPQFRN
jgi:DNA polymerase/3'-5' exonuclease PolX